MKTKKKSTQPARIGAIEIPIFRQKRGRNVSSHSNFRGHMRHVGMPLRGSQDALYMTHMATGLVQHELMPHSRGSQDQFTLAKSKSQILGPVRHGQAPHSRGSQGHFSMTKGSRVPQVCPRCSRGLHRVGRRHGAGRGAT